MPNKSERNLNPYLQQKILTASPEQLVAYTYDIAITACAQANAIKATEAIHVLVKSLRLDHKEIAGTFYRIYNIILSKIHRKQYEEARQLLLELRTTWAQAMRVS